MITDNCKIYFCSIEAECESKQIDRYDLKELFVTEKERQFNEQCRRELRRNWGVDP